MNIVIHHNPDCGTSRNVVELVMACGYVPTIIDYLKEGWTRPQLLGLLAAAGLTPHTALRETKSPARELGLLESGVSGDDILAQMLLHPVLVNLLERLPARPFQKEDGSLLDVTPFMTSTTHS
jgi:arsenate reductase (glutaredoxin)